MNGKESTRSLPPSLSPLTLPLSLIERNISLSPFFFLQGVFLDISHSETSWLRERFPSITKHLASKGLDIGEDVIPCVPAAHYACGGVEVDLVGRTNVRGLFACGEAARTGLHGANRLASTSLLEGLVWGSSVAEHIVNEEEGGGEGEGNLGGMGTLEDSRERDEVNKRATDLLKNLKKLMWSKVGIVRTSAGTGDAIEELSALVLEADELYSKVVSQETAALRDAATAGREVAIAAHANKISRGAHYVADSDAIIVDSLDADMNGDGLERAL